LLPEQAKKLQADGLMAVTITNQNLSGIYDPYKEGGSAGGRVSVDWDKVKISDNSLDKEILEGINKDWLLSINYSEKIKSTVDVDKVADEILVNTLTEYTYRTRIEKALSVLNSVLVAAFVYLLGFTVGWVIKGFRKGA
jgi:hypothetical protein